MVDLGQIAVVIKGIRPQSSSYLASDFLQFPGDF